MNFHTVELTHLLHIRVQLFGVLPPMYLVVMIPALPDANQAHCLTPPPRVHLSTRSANAMDSVCLVQTAFPFIRSTTLVGTQVSVGYFRGQT